MEDDDFEAGFDGEIEAGDYDTVIEDEAGIIEMIIPAAAAQRAKEQGKRARIPSGGRASKVVSPMKYIKENRRRITKLQALVKRLGARAEERGVDPLGGEDASTGPEGIRTLAGSTLAVAAPGAAGMAAFGPVVITAGATMLVSHLVVEVAEDTDAAAVAAIAPPFLVSALSIATVNTLKSNTPSIPGSVFSVSGGNYGWPVGAGRKLRFGSGTITSISGAWSPRVPAGAAAADVTAGFLCSASAV